MIRRLIAFVFAWLPVYIASSQTTYPNTEPETSGSPTPPEAAAAGMQLPEGFSAHVFASEPDVQNPIAMAWDSRGRLWVAENYTYSDRSQRFDLNLKDRVVIFDGTTKNHFTKRTIFTNDVQMLTGIEVTDQGVYLMCPPSLLFLPDRNQDDVPDGPAETLLDGFTVAQANYHNFANGIKFGPDGWLYGRCGGSCPGRIGIPGTNDRHRLAMEGGMWRYHPQKKIVEVLTTGTTNPWGHDFNDFGDGFFVNTVNGHLWHLIPGAHFVRPFTLDPNRETYELIDFHADHWHFDTGKAWHESRDGVANDFGGGHAHSGTLIYNDVVWPPEYRGELFTLNFHGRRANRETLVSQGGGYVAKHAPDFFLASDPWFRGMDLDVGPDGQVFVLDWSDAGECHEHDGVHRTSGRIFKINYDQAIARTISKVTPDDRSQIVSSLLGDSAWARRSAIKSLASVDRPQTALISDLQSEFESASSDVRQILALLAMRVAGQSDDDWLRKLLSHENQWVRVWGLRFLGETWPIDDALDATWKDEATNQRVRQESQPWIATLQSMASHDPSPIVRLTLASMLQRLPIESRSKIAEGLVSHSQDAQDHNLPKMIWYGLIATGRRSPDHLVAVARNSKLPKTTEFIVRFLVEQGASCSAEINEVLRDAAGADPLKHESILKGMTAALAGKQKATAPKAWPEFALSLDQNNPAVRELSTLFGDGRTLDELRAIVRGKKASDDAAQIAALDSLIRVEPDDLRELCIEQLPNAKLNLMAAKGLAKFGDPKVAQMLVARYGNFRSPEQPQLISILVSRGIFADQLLTAIEKQSIPRTALTAFDVRQIDSLGDQALSNRVREVWGDVRTTPVEEQKQIEALKTKLSTEVLTSADKSHGRALFNRLCQNCHQLYGEGAAVGPNLTGSGRSNLDYLLSNIVSPDSVVDKNFRMTILVLDDGQVINGLVLDQSPNAITIQTATEKKVIDVETIEDQKMTDNSPMPAGLLSTLSDDEIRDLIGYLQHPTQVPL
jgi:putative membrane-bound dehydrogenase-like protein